MEQKRPQEPPVTTTNMDSNNERMHCCVVKIDESTHSHDPSSCSVSNNPSTELITLLEPSDENDKGHSDPEERQTEKDNLESEVAWRNCEKNPGHSNFHRVIEFSVQHLPEGCQTHEVLSMVKAASDLTVRLRVGTTDPRRPQVFADHTNGSRRGSGFIIGITRAPRVPCRKRWYLDILSASHVVFSSEEAKATRIDLFHDDEGSMRTIKGKRVFNSHQEGDWSYLQCEIKDEELARRIESCIKHFMETEICMKRVGKTHEYFNTVVVISHPHGYFKMVTVGNVEKLSKQKDFSYFPENLFCSTQVRYNAPTCPGSSGAPVLWLGLRSRLVKNMQVYTEENVSPNAHGKHCPRILTSFLHMPIRRPVVLLITALLAAFVYLFDLDPFDRAPVKFTAFQVLGALNVWWGVLCCLRGYRLTDALASMKIINAQDRKEVVYNVVVDKHGASLLLKAFDYGLAILINLIQVSLLVNLSQHHPDIHSTALLFLIVFIILFTTSFLFKIYLKLQYHLLRSFFFIQRIFWGYGFAISLIISIKDYPYSCRFLPYLTIIISMFLHLLYDTLLIAIAICSRRWGFRSFDKILAAADTTLIFIHSRGGEHERDTFNKSHVSIEL